MGSHQSKYAIALAVLAASLSGCAIARPPVDDPCVVAYQMKSWLAAINPQTGSIVVGPSVQNWAAISMDCDATVTISNDTIEVEKHQ